MSCVSIVHSSDCQVVVHCVLCHDLFIHSPAGAHLSSFPFSAITNKATVSIHLEVFAVDVGLEWLGPIW